MTRDRISVKLAAAAQPVVTFAFDLLHALRAGNADMRSQLASIARSTSCTDKTLKDSAKGQQPPTTQTAA